jgi:hypothetical protein
MQTLEDRYDQLVAGPEPFPIKALLDEQVPTPEPGEPQEPQQRLDGMETTRRRTPTRGRAVHDWHIEWEDGYTNTARAYDETQARRIATRKRYEDDASPLSPGDLIVRCHLA